MFGLLKLERVVFDRFVTEKSTTLSLGIVSSEFPAAAISADILDERLRSLAWMPRGDMRNVRREGVFGEPPGTSLRSLELATEEEPPLSSSDATKSTLDELEELDVADSVRCLWKPSDACKRGDGGLPSLNGRDDTYAEETVMCSSLVPGFMNTGPLSEFLATAAVIPDAEEIEERIDEMDETDDCRSLGGILTGNN
ncbi:hypothetical protein QFC19_003605 [Naganishia cerealis]|uniref:Uncharacterized protein n=1 Tax=Naganishia cerealis TaxID=610337 RepID=A0ACC2W224_9TREE|nr:hypothetical protein QFC19_003605 [Naganishia cerealis]